MNFNTNNMEIWRDIKGYEGLYQVSNEGRVKALEKTWVSGNNSTKHKKETIIKCYTDNHGYLHLTLSKNGKSKKYLLHRLVADTFIDNPNEYTVVHHKDHNKQNNCLVNLEWVDEDVHRNIHNKEKSELYKGIIPKGNPPKTVYQYTKDKILISIYASSSEAARQTGFSQSCISTHCRDGKLYKNFLWSFTPLI